MRYLPASFAVAEPGGEAAALRLVVSVLRGHRGRLGQNLGQRERGGGIAVRVFALCAQRIDHVREFGVLAGAAGVDDVPEGLGLRRRRLRIEVGEVERGEIRRDMAIAALVVPAPQLGQ